MRVAIYARYSSELQSDNSIDDQIKLVKSRLNNKEHTIVKEYSDAAISGTTLLRPGMAALLAAARETPRPFDMIAAESLDRISRDLADIAQIYKDLSFIGVNIWTVEDGEIGKIQIGIKGMMSEMYIDGMRDKIRRGCRGQTTRGKQPGGLSYGYKVAPEITERGEIIRGGRAINEDQAAIVRRIFRQYAAGVSPRDIAGQLNQEGVPAPRGKHWRASSIQGHRARQSGFLHNTLYIGQLQYGRTTFLKNPKNGKRVSKLGEKDDIVTTQVESLRIIDDDLWEKVHSRMRQNIGRRPELQQRPKWLLAGLVHCGLCGGRMTPKDKERVVCMEAKESRTCSNYQTIKKTELEERTLGRLKRFLSEPRFVKQFIKAYHAERSAFEADKTKHILKTENELSDLVAEISHLVDAIANGANVPEIAQSLQEKSARRQTLEAELSALGTNSVTRIHPSAGNRFAQIIDEMAMALRNPDDIEAKTVAIERLRLLVSKVTVTPTGKRGENDVRLEGQIETALDFLEGRTTPLQGYTMVAEEGFEPPTHGL